MSAGLERAVGLTYTPRAARISTPWSESRFIISLRYAWSTPPINAEKLGGVKAQTPAESASASFLMRSLLTY